MTTMKKYIPTLVIKGSTDAFADFRQTAQDNLEQTILGPDLVTKLELKNDADIALRRLVERVISISGFLLGAPSADLVLTETGFAVESSDKMSPASRLRVDALLKSLADRLDEATDVLISFLVRSSTYEDWRGTTQFDDIASGLISTYREFKQYAQYSPAVAEKYPKSYAEFSRLYPNLNSALMIDVAPYISADYCSELIEKYKDGDISSVEEKLVISYLKYALTAFVLEDRNTAMTFTLKAVAFMRKKPNSFPTFIASPEAASLDSVRENTPFYSMMG